MNVTKIFYFTRFGYAQLQIEMPGCGYWGGEVGCVGGGGVRQGSGKSVLFQGQTSCLRILHELQE